MPQLKPIRGKFLPKPDGSPEGCLIASLIGCWLMNEGTGDTVFDLSGNGNTGTSNGCIWVPGKCGPAQQYDGTDDYTDCGSNAILNCDGDEITIVMSLRQKPSSTIDQYDCMIGRTDDSGYGYRLWTRDSSSFKYYWNIRLDAIDETYISSTTLISSTDFQHVVGVCKASSYLKLYVNGVEEASELTLSHGWADNGPLLIGCMFEDDAPNQKRWFPMDLEYLLVFNRALSASEIALLYREPFCMFARTGRPYLRSEQIVNLAGTSAGQSSLIATAKAIRKVGGNVACVSDSSGFLGITGEEPSDIEMSWLREALFNGMTANAFKLGTALSLGWFWARIAGCSALYRGYNMEEIDFANILAVTEQDDCEISPPEYISHSSGSTYFYIIRRFNSCGYQERTLAAAIKFSIESNGDPAEPKPNKVFDSISGPVDGSKIRLVWFYCPIEQKSKPVCFNVYYDNRTGQIDYQNPIAVIDYKGRKFYSFQSGTLEAGKYLFVIRAEDSGGLENSSLSQLNIQLDTINLNEINIVRAEAV